MKKVLIVREGRWGASRPQDYDPIVDLCVEVLSNAEREFSGRFGEAGEKIAKVEVVPTALEAQEKIRKEGADIVIFISRGMEDAAERFAAMFSNLKVIVLTGLIPGGKVIWVSKNWICDIKILKTLVLQG